MEAVWTPLPMSQLSIGPAVYRLTGQHSLYPDISGNYSFVFTPDVSVYRLGLTGKAEVFVGGRFFLTLGARRDLIPSMTFDYDHNNARASLRPDWSHMTVTGGAGWRW
jgi:hypothetical protein